MAQEAPASAVAYPTAVLDQLEYSVLVTDAHGTIEYVNAAFTRAMGYAPGEVIGKSARILSKGFMPADVYDDIFKRLQSGQPRRSTFPHKTKAGDTIREDISISPVRNEDGAVTQLVWIARPAERQTSIELFTYLANSSPSGVFVLRGDKFFFTNLEFQIYTGYTNDQLYGTNSLRVVHPDDRDRVTKRRASAGTDSSPYEYRLIDAEGEEKWVLEKVTPVDFLKLGSAESSFVAATIVDISDRKHAEEQLQFAVSLNLATVEATADGLIVIDTTRRIRQLNGKFLEMWGLPDQDSSHYTDIGGDPVWVHMQLQMKDPEAFKEWAGNTFFADTAETSTVIELKDGRIFEVHSTPHIINGGITGRVWSYRDITERRRFEDTLMHMANYDALTGLLNRRRYQEEVEEGIAQLRTHGQTGALLLLDADRFKDVNDSFGHQTGDDVLVQLSAILKSSFPRRLVSRFGGEEFAVFLPNVTLRAARHAATRFISTLNRRTITASGNHLRVTMSIGIAMYPAHGATLRELFSRADIAMYDAKFAGRNRLAVYSGQGRPQAEQLRLNWRDRFHDALRNKRLALVGQPIVTTDGELRGYELLVRLRDPNGKLLPAKDFIPIAEQMGLLKRIDEWVVMEALALLKQVQEQKLGFRIGLNLGGWAFADHKMLDFLEGAFTSADVDPSGLIVEMTETSAVADVGKARTFIEALQSLGCSFALDDFGVGYSSFDYLKRLPVDIIKIDGSFIRDLTHSKTSQEIVSAFVQVAKGLGVVSLAESVENHATFELAKQLGVNNLQGNWIGRPRAISRLLLPFEGPAPLRQAA